MNFNDPMWTPISKLSAGDVLRWASSKEVVDRVIVGVGSTAVKFKSGRRVVVRSDLQVRVVEFANK